MTNIEVDVDSKCANPINRIVRLKTHLANKEMHIQDRSLDTDDDGFYSISISSDSNPLQIYHELNNFFNQNA